MKRTSWLVFSLLVSLVLTSQNALAQQPAQERPDSVYAALKGNKELSAFVALLDKAELGPALKDAGSQVTVFAPTNAALKKIPSDMQTKIKEDEKAFASNHIVLGSVIFAGNIRGRMASISTHGSSMIFMDGREEPYKINTATISQGDIRTKNGVVHIISEALIPSNLTEKEQERLLPNEPREFPMDAPSAEGQAPAETTAAPPVPTRRPAPAVPAPTQKQTDKPEEKKGLLKRLFGS